LNPESSQLPRAWLIVGLLWFVALLNYLDRVMITTIRGSLIEAIPMSDAQFGLLTTVFLIVYALLSPLGGFLADRLSRSGVILASLFIWSALTWATGHAKTYEQLLVVRALMGASEAAYIPAALALIADYHRGATRSLATGVHMTGISVGSGLGGIGGWLAERHEWGFAFELFGIVGIVYAIALIFLLRDPPAAPRDASAPEQTYPQARFGEALASLLRRGSFLLLILFWGLLGLTGWAVVGWMPTFLGEHFHLKQGAAGMSATGYSHLASLIGLLVGGGWADQWSRTNERGRILVPAIGLSVAATGVLLVATTGQLGFAIAGLLLYGLARSFTDANLMPILCQIADPRYRATGYGVLNMFGCLVGGATVYLGGAMRDAHFNLQLLFQCAAGSLLFCAALMLLVKPGRSSTPA
jgi:MFS family permease